MTDPGMTQLGSRAAGRCRQAGTGQYDRHPTPTLSTSPTLRQSVSVADEEPLTANRARPRRPVRCREVIGRTTGQTNQPTPMTRAPIPMPTRRALKSPPTPKLDPTLPCRVQTQPLPLQTLIPATTPHPNPSPSPSPTNS